MNKHEYDALIDALRKLVECSAISKIAVEKTIKKMEELK